MKKIASIGLSIATIVTLSGSILPASAATAADIQAQINALLAQIQSLQSQLSSSTGTSATTSYSFTRDLTVGSKGADVTALQNFLIGQPSAMWPSGQAATGYFGNVTKAAVAKFQAAVGLTPPAGYFGAKTRAYVASTGAGSTGGTTTGGTTTGGTVVAPATGLAVSYASDNPSGSASLISGAARVPVLALNYTAGNSGAVTLTGVKFTKTGVISDSSISGAY
ncbi:MAG: peptidoglycan-binding domain-containing protein, partial [Candidatus Wolfebacteria bacterium]|nr:peptidoglycan-binding domain-containing protein [Candidatus Wolfebacteria bacterium]